MLYPSSLMLPTIYCSQINGPGSSLENWLQVPTDSKWKGREQGSHVDWGIPTLRAAQLTSKPRGTGCVAQWGQRQGASELCLRQVRVVWCGAGRGGKMGFREWSQPWGQTVEWGDKDSYQTECQTDALPIPDLLTPAPFNKSHKWLCAVRPPL